MVVMFPGATPSIGADHLETLHRVGHTMSQPKTILLREIPSTSREWLRFIRREIGVLNTLRLIRFIRRLPMSDDHVMYPEKAPIHCGMELIRIVREKKLASESKEFGLHAWNVQGFIQRVMVGIPNEDVQPIFGNSDSEECFNDCICELQSTMGPLAELGDFEVYTDASENELIEALGDDAVKIDPTTIAMIIQIAVQVFEMIKLWRNR